VHDLSAIEYVSQDTALARRLMSPAGRLGNRLGKSRVPLHPHAFTVSRRITAHHGASRRTASTFIISFGIRRRLHDPRDVLESGLLIVEPVPALPQPYDSRASRRIG